MQFTKGYDTGEGKEDKNESFTAHNKKIKVKKFYLF